MLQDSSEVLDITNTIHIATCHGESDYDNASFIVRACNQHTALLAVAEAAQKLLRHLPGEYHDNDTIALHKALSNLNSIKG